MPQIIETLKDILEKRGQEIEGWLEAARRKHSPFIYTSVDLRHSGLKLAPVDTNLFPAGFNNLSTDARTRAVQYMKAWIAREVPGAGRCIVLPESHTRNLKYFDSLLALKAILEEAGLETRFGLLVEDAPALATFTSASGGTLAMEPVRRRGGKLEMAGGFVPELVVVNNDFTTGAPDIVEGLEQKIAPPPGMGWHRRRKSVHFEAYSALTADFAAGFGLDSWLISTIVHHCGRINFKEMQGLECVALGVEKVLHSVRRKYEEYGVKETPYAFIKADGGTYGMGIMTVRSGDEVMELNKKLRNKMNVVKGGATNTEVLIQEGVVTVDKIDGQTAEPMLYLVDGRPVGGAWRVNEEKDSQANLNAPGMRFAHLCDALRGPGFSLSPEGTVCHFKVFGLIAELAALAAAREEYGPAAAA